MWMDSLQSANLVHNDDLSRSGVLPWGHYSLPVSHAVTLKNGHICALVPAYLFQWRLIELCAI